MIRQPLHKRTRRAVAAAALAMLLGVVTSCGSSGTANARGSAAPSSGASATSGHPSSTSGSASTAQSAASAVPGATGNSQTGTVTQLNVLSFKPPSLGAFLPAVIKAKHFDTQNGLDINFAYEVPDSYYADFAAGHYQVGASAGLLTTALENLRGADVAYLFNIFDFYGAVVTSNPAIKALSDLPGHTLAAATGTTNYAMFKWFAQQANVDVSKIKVTNESTAGLSTMAISGRSDAVELWEPAYSSLLGAKPDIRTLDIGLPDVWKSKFQTTDIPYLGVAVHVAWAKSHQQQVTDLYNTYKAAADWTLANPADAGAIIAKTLPRGNASIISDLIKHNERLGLHLQPASSLAQPIKDVFEAGKQVGYLNAIPSDSVIYSGLS